MPGSMLCSFLATILFFSHLVAAAEYGVGFHLSLDYGIASVYFSNGSAVDIAKIAGGPSYQQIMRSAYIPERNDDGLSPSKTLESNQLDPTLRYLQVVLHLRSLLDQVPSWLGRKQPRFQPLVRMLRGLKAAAESYLETTISAAEIVVPFPATEEYRHALRSACSSISLRMPNSVQPSAGIRAAQAYGVGKKPCQDIPGADDDPQQLILTVEYSRAALTALVVHEECTVFEHRRVLHNTELGIDRLRGEPEAGHEKMEAALKELVTLPMDDGGNGEELKYINNLVLLGESAGDEQLHHVLRKVLDGQYGRLVNTVGQRGLSDIDPLFAASRGVAFDCWDRLNYGKNGLSNHSCLPH